MNTTVVQQLCNMRRCSSVGKKIKLHDRRIGVWFLDKGKGFLFILHAIQESSGTYPDGLWNTSSLLNGIGSFSPGVKRKGREADLSHSFTAEAKSGEAIPPLPICLYGTVLI
jgi:hypothetical protein